jgi:histone deacetylase complex regulatory component SIN3
MSVYACAKVCDFARHFWQVAQLFAEHKDLLEEFQHFLPDTSVAPQAVASSRGGLVKREDRGSLVPLTNRTLHGDKVEMICSFLGSTYFQFKGKLACMK